MVQFFLRFCFPNVLFRVESVCCQQRVFRTNLSPLFSTLKIFFKEGVKVEKPLNSIRSMYLYISCCDIWVLLPPRRSGLSRPFLSPPPLYIRKTTCARPWAEDTLPTYLSLQRCSITDIEARVFYPSAENDMIVIIGNVVRARRVFSFT